MLELQSPEISYKKNEFYPSQKIVLHYHQPLLMKGPGELRRAFFQQFSHLKNWQITQAGKSFNNKDVLPHVIELTPDLHVNTKLKIAKLMRLYTSLPENQWHTILPSYMDPHAKLSSYSLDDQRLIQTIIMVQQNSLLLCIRGDWNLCSESLKNKVCAVLSRSMDHHNYILVEEGSEELIPYAEIWDMEGVPSVPVTNFLEEIPDISKMINQHHPFIQGAQLFTWKTAISGVLYMLLASIFIMFSTHFFLLFYDELQAYEHAMIVDEDHQIPIYVVGSHPDEDQFQLLQNIVGAYPLYPMKEAQIKLAIDFTDPEGMYTQTISGMINTIPEEVQQMLCDTCDQESEGIYISETFAKEYALEEGQFYNATIEIPLRYYIMEEQSMAQGISKNNTVEYIPLYESYEVSLPIKKVISTLSPFITYTQIHNNDILMDEILYEDIQKQILEKGALFQKGDPPENLSQRNYVVSEATELIPYTPTSYLLLVSSKEEAEHICDVLETQREVNVWTDNPLDSLTEMAGYLQKARTMTIQYLSKYCWILAGIAVAALALNLHMIKRAQSFELFHNKKPLYRIQFALLFIGMLTITLSLTVVLSSIEWYDVFSELSRKLSFETMSMKKLQFYNTFLSYMASFSFDKLVILSSCVSVFIASFLPYLAVSSKLHLHRAHKIK